VVTEIVGFDSPDSELYIVAHAHNLLKSGDFLFLEKAILEECLPKDESDVTVAEFTFSQEGWTVFYPARV
jgi:hypothetical protein